MSRHTKVPKIRKWFRLEPRTVEIIEEMRKKRGAKTASEVVDDLIRQRILAADAEIDRGEYTEYGADEMDRLSREIRERGLKRLGR